MANGNGLLARIGLAVGAPLALAAVLGTGIVMAQQSGGTPTPSTTQESPADETPSGDDKNHDGNKSNGSGHDCDLDSRESDGSENGSSDDVSTSV